MKGVRSTAMILLAFLGVGAVVGSIPMIIWPMQTQWNLLPVNVLQYSPFHSFLLPGIILLVANGILAFWALWCVIARRSQHELWTAFQGCVSLGWLLVECGMIRAIGWPHYLYGVIALGFAMRRSATPQPGSH